MFRIFYSAAFYVAVPFILLRIALRSLRAPAYRQRLAERFALTAVPVGFDRSRTTLWIHAVSVGETVAAAPLIRALKQRYPEAQILITTMTPTGSERVRSLFTDSVFHRYIPYDLPGAVNRFIRQFNPALLVLMETELWPNLIHGCHHHHVKLLLANARLSERSAARYRRLSGATRKMLGQIDSIAGQSQADASRFRELGAAAVSVTGSLKFLVDAPAVASTTNPVFDSIRQSQRPVLVAASTRDGEEQKVLSAFRRCLEVCPTLLLLLIPRHPERFDRVARSCEEFGFAVSRRSSNGPVADSVQVCLGDSMGEMLAYYQLATLAFVGGSLVDTGCQNVLEPAAMGIPVIVGPSQYNFATICARLEQVGALITVQDEQELAVRVIELCGEPERRAAMGNAGKALVQANKEALPALLLLIDSLLAGR